MNGSATLTDLKDGTYQIREVSAPTGYIITSKTPVEFTIEKGAVVTTGESAYVLTTGVTYAPKQDAVEADPDNGVEGQDATPDTFTIPNTPGASLPATGGPGTTAFYATGAALILLALALLLRRKKELD